jgi:D-beta-D-heptose 7-phosphate kinase / D-beta-D-heptose 1-phosphate adenosyltransferase
MSSNLLAFFDSFATLKILVIGEAMLDRYLMGSSSRLSQEAPVQVVNIGEKEDIPGGAANTAANIRSLGAEPIFLSVVGQDEEAAALRESLRKLNISDAYIFGDETRQTLAKQRVLANGQMMIRFDQGSTEPISKACEKQLIETIQELMQEIDAIIISDYNYGVISPGILKALAAIQEEKPRILVVDSKQFKAYKDLHVTAIKPNYYEAMKILHQEPKESSEERVRQVQKHGPKLLEAAHAQIAAITMDQDGALIFERDRPCYRIYARPAEHNRVSGAGDTFMSALTLALAAGAQTSTAAEIASAAAAIVVQKPGTSTCYIEELKDYFSGDDKYITDSFHMAARVEAYRRKEKTIVFTNGCFDLLHSGHIQYLNQAKMLGDILVVGINTDEGVRRLKGPNRPINSLDDRAQVLAALSCVDHIIPFDEEIPYSLINLIKPDIFAKGGDYNLEMLPEAQLVEELDGKVVILPYMENHSTSGIIERIGEIVSLEKPNKEIPDKQAPKKARPKKDVTRKEPLKLE